MGIMGPMDRDSRDSTTHGRLTQKAEEYSQLLRKIKNNSAEVTSVFLDNYSQVIEINYKVFFDTIKNNSHIKMLGLDISKPEFLLATFNLMLNTKLPLTDLTLNMRINPIFDKPFFGVFLSDPKFKLQRLSFIHHQGNYFNSVFIDDLFNALKDNTTIESLSLPLNDAQQEKLMIILRNFNSSLKEVNAENKLLPELKSLLKRNRELPDEIIARIKNNNNSKISDRDLNFYIQKFKTEKHPEVVSVLQRHFPQLSDFFMENNLFFDIWCCFKAFYVKNINFSLSLATLFLGGDLFTDASFSQLIVLYFVLNAKHLIYQEAIDKVINDKNPIPIHDTFKKYHHKIIECDRLIAQVSSAFFNQKSNANSFVSPEHNRNIVLQKTQQLLLTYPNVFSDMNNVEVLEEKLLNSDFQWVVHTSQQVQNNNNNNQIAYHYDIETEIMKTVTQAMHQFELMRVLKDDTLVVTEAFITFILQPFDKPSEKLRVLDDIADVIAPDALSFFSYPVDNTPKSWSMNGLFFKSKIEATDLRTKITLLQIIYQNMIKQQSQDTQIQTQLTQSPLLKIHSKPIKHHNNNNNDDMDATDIEMQEMHRPGAN